MRHETGEFTGRGGVRLFRQSWLPPAPPRASIVNLHGLGDHSGLYAALGEHFAGRGIAVHAFDMRGHGRSPGQRAYLADWREYRDDLDTFVQLVGAVSGPLFTLGSSLGGLVVLDHALHHPERLSGVIAAAPPLGAVGVPRVLMALGRVMSHVWPRFSLQVGMDLSGLSRDPDSARMIVEDPLFHRRGTARLSTEVTVAIERVHALAPELAVPALLLHGAADRMVPPDGTRAFCGRLPAGLRTLIEYPEAYHALFADLDAAVVLADIETWIDATLGRRSAPPA
ncbi:MAG: alpha/beta hydrolase [Gemmatimonadales bacterium]|nr:alpha/beta hydrolase [Gemmatimonadales bacterium]